MNRESFARTDLDSSVNVFYDTTAVGKLAKGQLSSCKYGINRIRRDFDVTAPPAPPAQTDNSVFSVFV